MLWFNRKASKSEGSNFEKNAVENFEQVYQQETQIHKKWQEIEDSALRLKRKYEADPSAVQFIDYLRVLEKAFEKGKIKGWTNAQIREELIQGNIEELSVSAGKIDKQVADELRESFKKMHTTAQRVNEAAEQILERYTDRPEYHAFIRYLRDVWIAFLQSEETHESAQGFKERLVAVRMDLLVSEEHVDMEELRKIYSEFRRTVEE